MSDWLRHLLRMACTRYVSDHGFVPLDWASGCGHLDHPHADRCGLPGRCHHERAR